MRKNGESNDIAEPGKEVRESLRVEKHVRRLPTAYVAQLDGGGNGIDAGRNMAHHPDTFLPLPRLGELLSKPVDLHVRSRWVRLARAGGVLARHEQIVQTSRRVCSSGAGRDAL